MRLLYGTNNQGKLKRLQAVFADTEIEIVGPRDLGIQINAEEAGETPLENARLKAEAFYQASGIATFAVDSGLYMDKLPDDLQPGVFVRRVGGRELKDQEMFDYYRKLLMSIGGRSPGFWRDGMVLINECGELFEQEFREETFLTAEASPVRVPGLPLGALQIDPELNLYKSEITAQQRLNKSNRFDRKVFEFIMTRLAFSSDGDGASDQALIQAARHYAWEQIQLMENRDRLKRRFRDRWDHTKRVLAWANRLHQKEGGDWTVIELATWLHDCGYQSGLPHAQVSAEKAKAFFDSHPYNKADLVLALIENHSRKEDPDQVWSVELKILMDADTLDEKGALAIILDAISEGMENPHARYEDVYGRIIRYFPEVRREAIRLKTETGKAIFQRKIDWMEGCIEAIREELGE
jgi:HD superfamily phosphodiesterase